MTYSVSPSSVPVDVSTLTECSRIVGPNFRVVEPLPVSGPVLSGCYGVRPLRSGLVLHASDAVDLHDLVTRVEHRPGVSIQVFLQGAVNATVGGKPVLGSKDALEAVRHGAPRAVMLSRTQPELFERHGQRGQRMRKVSLSLSPEWLENNGFMVRDASAIGRFFATHLAQRVWSPGARLAALAERMITFSASPDPVAELYLESHALELVAEALGGLDDEPGASDATGLDARDRQRMRRVEDFLNSTTHPVVSLEELGRAVGTSVSTLQRLFQAAHGASAFEVIRRRNLERARDALAVNGVTVKEAAYLAGYSSSANFSTAFRKMFGCTPTQVRGGRGA